jgi:predicted transglutaminase-like cysteine proteinase
MLRSEGSNSLLKNATKNITERDQTQYRFVRRLEQ